MREYIKPTIEVIELRVNEEIATASGSASLGAKQATSCWGIYPTCTSGLGTFPWGGHRHRPRGR